MRFDSSSAVERRIVRPLVLAAFLLPSLPLLPGGESVAVGAFLDPLAFPSQGVLSLGAANYTLDTSGTPTLRDASNNILFTGTTVAQASAFNPTVAVFSFDSISLAAGGRITIVGSRPAAMLSRSTAAIDGLIAADGSKGEDGTLGAPGAGAIGGPGGARGGDGAPSRDVQASPGQGPGGGPAPISSGLDINANGVGGGYGGIGGHNVLGPNPFGPTYGDLHVALEAGSGGSGSNDPGIFSRGAGGGGGGGAFELGAIDSIVVAGTIRALGGNGGAEAVIGYMGGGGSGGGLLLHAASISVQFNSRIDATGGSLNGGGGRILFLTESGTITNQGGTVTTGPTLYGGEGVITYGTLSVVPEPGSIVPFGLGAVGIAATMRRRNKTA